jgi:hypothetical protein
VAPAIGLSFTTVRSHEPESAREDIRAQAQTSKRRALIPARLEIKVTSAGVDLGQSWSGQIKRRVARATHKAGRYDRYRARPLSSCAQANTEEKPVLASCSRDCVGCDFFLIRRHDYYGSDDESRPLPVSSTFQGAESGD